MLLTKTNFQGNVCFSFNCLTFFSLFPLWCVTRNIRTLILLWKAAFSFGTEQNNVFLKGNLLGRFSLCDSAHSCRELWIYANYHFPSNHEELRTKHISVLGQIFKPIAKPMGSAVTFNSSNLFFFLVFPDIFFPLFTFLIFRRFLRLKYPVKGEKNQWLLSVKWTHTFCCADHAASLPA